MKEQMKKGIGRVTAGEGSKRRIGTAFLVAERYALTALHVVADRARMLKGEKAVLNHISITFKGATSPIAADVVDNCWDGDEDWALLKLEKMPEGVSPISSFGILPDGAKPPFEAFGYPIEHGSLMVGGEVTDARASYYDASVLQLFTKEAAAGKGDPLNGLSGAPCIVGSYVVGVVRAHPVKEELIGSSTNYTVRNGILFACSIETVASRCVGLIPSPTQLTFKVLNHSLEREEEVLASLQYYQSALHSYSATLPYHLPGREDLDIGSAHIDLPATTTLAGQKDPINGTAIELTAQGLKTHRVVIVVGPPGAGKTSLYHFLAQVLWDKPERAGFDQRRLVILCRLRDLARVTGGTAGDRIRRAMACNKTSAMGGSGISEDFLESWPEQTRSKLLFLFDGFDEVPDSEREDLALWLKSLLEGFPEAECVITSRDPALFTNTSFKADRGLAAYVQLTPPTREQAVAVASSWIANGAGEFVQRVRDTELEGTLSTPLGIALSASVFLKRRILPEYRAGLYGEYVKIALEEAMRQGVDTQTDLKVDGLLYLLQRLAYRSTEFGQISEAEALKELQAVLREKDPSLPSIEAKARSEELYRVLTERSGIFVGGAEWKHETFREFLAAQYLFGESKPDSLQVLELMKKHRDFKWQSLLLFLFSLWSSDASKSSDREIEIYRGVFEACIGKSKKAPGIIHRWIIGISQLLGNAPVEQEDVSQPSLSSRSEVFAVQALIEIGAAPQDIEENILRSLLANQSSIELAMSDPCAAVFSTDFFANKKLRLLECWAKIPRLNRRLDPWVKTWFEDLCSRTGNGLKEFGLLWLCRREKEIETLLQQQPLGPAWCHALLHTLHSHHRWEREEAAIHLQRIAISKLREQNCDDLTSLGELGSISECIKDPSRFLSGHTVTETINPFSDHVWLSTFMKTLEAVNVANKFIKDQRHDPQQWQDIFESRVGRMWTERVLAVWKTSRHQIYPLLVTIESFEPHILKLISINKETPAPLRRFIEWYVLLPQKDKADNVPQLWGQYSLSMAADLLNLVGVSGHALSSVPTPVLLEELAHPDTHQKLAAAIVTALMEQRAFSGLLQVGLREQASRGIRILALKSLEREAGDEEECRTVLVSLCSEHLSEQPNDISMLKTRAEMLLKLERYEEAEHDWTAIISSSPHDGDALEWRANVRYLRGDTDAALDDIDQSLECEGDHRYGFYLKGVIFLEKNNYRVAIQSFDAAEKSGNSELRLYQRRACSYFGLGLLEEAIKDLETVLARDQSHAQAHLLKALCLSSLGRWADSETLIEGMEDILSRENGWVTLRLQNELGLHGTEKALTFLLSLDAAYKLTAREETIGLFLQHSSQQEPAEARAGKIQALLEPGTDVPYMQIRFWLFMLNNEVNACKAHLDYLVEGKCEADLGWIVLDATATLNPFLPVWVMPLIGQASYVLKTLTPVETTSSVQSHTTKQDAAEQKHEAVAVQSAGKRTKCLFENGMLCRLRMIDGYEDELQLGKEILGSHKQQIAIVVIPLLDSGHIYIQANVKYDDTDSYDFKLAGEYTKFRDQGALIGIIEQKQIQKVIVTQKDLYHQMLTHPAMAPLRTKLVLEPRSLPYTDKDVEFTFLPQD